MRHTERTDPQYPLPDCVGSGLAMYDVPIGDGGPCLTSVMCKRDGSYYAENGKWDFVADDADAMRAKLRKYGAKYVGWEN